MAKNLSAAYISNFLRNIRPSMPDGSFRSVELTKALKASCGSRANEVLSDLENYGVVEFVRPRLCRFAVSPTVANIEGLI